MTRDEYIFILTAIGAKRRFYLENWLAAHQYNPDAMTYWADKLQLTNDADNHFHQMYRNNG